MKKLAEFKKLAELYGNAHFEIDSDAVAFIAGLECCINYINNKSIKDILDSFFQIKNHPNINFY